MAKQVQSIVKLQLPGGKANPAPPVGPVLGQHGVNIMEFCKQFNARTQKQMDEVLPVILTVYKDRSFTFDIKKSPVSYLIKKALKLEKGSGVPNKDKVGVLKKAQVYEIAQTKMDEMTAADLEAAYKSVAGTARSMGVDIVD